MNRRHFIKQGATATTLAALTSAAPRPLYAAWNSVTPQPLPSIERPEVKALALRALDAARSAGATYADVRLSHSWQRNVGPDSVNDAEMMSVGVRVLYEGYWGFASGPLWNADEMVRLGREAFFQAKANTVGKARQADLAPAPRVEGSWTMPIKINPFEVSPLEIMDYLRSLEIYIQRTPGAGVQGNGCQFIKHETAFAATTGSYCVQRRYRTAGSLLVSLVKNRRQLIYPLDSLSPAGVGWELYQDQPMRDRIQALITEMREDLELPVNPVDVGRYDTVFDAEGVTALVHNTIVGATELDRALGYEANAGGTSYLNDPLAMVGSYTVGSPSLSLSANRSELGGCATVQWDDEGVIPDTFSLVTDGVLSDFQTTREGAGWLKEYYQRQGRPIRSHGCASALMGIYAPMSRAPNVVMAPGRESLDFDALMGSMTKGLAVKGARVDMDFQYLNGMVGGRVYEVKSGKRVALVSAAGILFRTPELWKGLLGLGGSASARRFGLSSMKGEPQQEHYTSVTAVPAVFKQLSLIDALRKA